MTECDSTLWVRRFHPAPDAPVRLACLPHAGGSATFFTPLSRTLSPDVDLVAVQYPGRQDRRRESPIESLDELARLVTVELLPWTNRPLALFGHSLGAALGFEVARLLVASGRVPVVLFASGRRAPDRVRPERNHHLDDDDGLLRKVRALSGTDDRLLADEELIRMVLPAIRSDYRAMETHSYRPGPPLPCAVTVMTGSEDPHVSADEAAAWREHTTASFELVTFPGGHFFLMDRGREVADVIRKALFRSRQPGSF